MNKMAPPVCPACGKKNSWKFIGEGKSGYSLGIGLIAGVILAIIAAFIFIEIVVVACFFIGLLFGFYGKKHYTYYCTNCGLKNEYKESFPEHMRARIPDDEPTPPAAPTEPVVVTQPAHLTPSAKLAPPAQPTPPTEQKKGGCLSAVVSAFFALLVISAVLSTCSGGSMSSYEYLDTLSDAASPYYSYY